MIEKPRIRQIEALPVDTPKGRIIVLRDPFGFSPAVLQVSQEAFYIITLLDGTRDLRNLQAQFLRQFGQTIHPEHLEELFVQLDSCHFLDNDNYRELREKTISDFLESPFRPASHAGEAYPDTEPALREEFDRLFSENGGFEVFGEVENTVRGFIAPHIDLQRGAATYAAGYRELASKSSAETYVVLGTAHTGMKNHFCLTLKDFETPFGMLENDRGLGEELLAACPWLTEDEFTHKNEHSVEFQALFLQYIFGGKRDIKIVPVLCGPFLGKDGRHEEPEKHLQVAEFIEALATAIKKRNGSVCIIAGADLAHVGTRFGDPQPINETQLKYIEELDRTSLAFAENCDAEGFYKHVTSDGDKRKICGLPNIYAMLGAVGDGKGRIIEYGQAPDEQTGSVVTFASLVVE